MTRSAEPGILAGSRVEVALTPEPVRSTSRRAREYAELKRIVESQGLLDGRPGYFVAKCALNLLLLALAVLLLPLAVSNPWWWLFDVVFLAFVFVQIALLGHDLLHLQFGRGRRTNTLLGLVLGNLIVGVSRAWWIDNHNAHHARPNDLARDPNLDILFFAFTPEQALGRPPWVRWVIRHQTVLLFPIFCLEFFSMRQLSLSYAARRGVGCARGEGVLLCAHLVLYSAILVASLGVGGAILFALVHHALTGLYMASIFAPNHKGMPLMSEAAPLGFLREQVLTARNVRGNWLIDLVYGGLNYQIEHHLFPTCARANLRRLQPIVRAYCQERNINYCESTLTDSWRAILAHFADVSRALERA